MCPFDEYETVFRIDSYFEPAPFIKDFLDKLVAGELVESIDVKRIKFHVDSSRVYTVRNIIGCTTPTLAWAREMKKVVGNGKVLEICSGTGLVAKYLDAVGIDIKATDNYSYYREVGNHWKLYFDVEELDFKDAIQKYRADYLLICWPYFDSLAREAAELFTQLNPDGLILFIGEWCGGATADVDFFMGTEVVDKLESVNDQYPQWMGVSDLVYLMKWVGIPED